MKSEGNKNQCRHYQIHKDYIKTMTRWSMVLVTGVFSVSAMAWHVARDELKFSDSAPQHMPGFEMDGFSFLPGTAVFDYDNNQWPDIYVLNGKGSPNALYRNMGDDGFVESGQLANLADLGQGTGLAVGDLNNDGYDDLYLAQGTTVGDGIDSLDGLDRVFINQGNGSFVDITPDSGINEPGFSTAIAMADYDSDGDLDIAVGRFIDFDFNDPTANRTNPTKRTHLYRNNGDLTFTEVSQELGVIADFNTWAISWFDYDRDGDIDLFLAHEQGPISIFNNDGAGHFDNVTEQAGDVKAFGAWMGLAIGDYNNDGWQDIFATNISDLRVTRNPALPPLAVPPPETWDNPWPALFRNNGDGTFTELGEQAGVSIPQEFSWGTFFADFNNDGWQDLYVAQNFAPVGVINTADEGAGPGRVFINQRNGRFVDVAAISGAANTSASGDYLDARGAAYTDFNRDGRIDILLQNAPQFEELFPFGSTLKPGTGVLRLWVNESSDNNRWIGLQLVGSAPSNCNAVGAKVRLRSRGRWQYREITGGGSAFSYSERIVHFGLGRSRWARVEVTWPDGQQQTFNHLSSNRYWTIKQGGGEPVSNVSGDTVPTCAD